MTIVSDFIATYGQLANNVAMQTGLSQAEILGQWGNETGWGSHFAGTNNLGNVSPGGKVANYSTPQEGALAYIQTLQREGINTRTLGSDPAAFSRALESAGYAPAPYASNVNAAIQTAINNGAVTNPSSGNFNDGPIPSGGYHVTITGTSETPATNSTGDGKQSNDGSKSGTGVGFDFGLGWLEGKLGDIGLIIFGLILIAGVTLISGKKISVNLNKLKP